MERQYFAYNPQREIHIYVEASAFSTKWKSLQNDYSSLSRQQNSNLLACHI